MGRFRNERINVRLADFEKEIFYKQMKRAGHKNVTDFIMTAICKHHSTVVDTAPILEIKGELNRIGCNVNQLAKVANSTQSIYADDVEMLRNNLTAVQDLVEKAFQMCVEGRKVDCGVHEDNADTDKLSRAESV
ncbi:MAG: plasmid mobilization relaxosome protein MobC [Firmicutes bacterium]|nr:plasmid mobilization relaxosome protein MobC [Bacillota bacterium]